MSDLIATYGLTPLQNALVCEYLGNGFNKKKAADKLDCSVGLFSDAKVQNAINDRAREILAETNFKAIHLINHLSEIATANIVDYVEWNGKSARVKDGIPPEMMACVKSLHTDKDGVTRVELHDKYGAIDRLAKILKWTGDEAQSVVNVTVNESSDKPVDLESLARKIAFVQREAENKNIVIDVELEDGGD